MSVFTASSCTRRRSSSSFCFCLASFSAFLFSSLILRCLIISVGVRAPLAGYCGVGPVPDAAREPPFWVRPLLTAAAVGPTPPRSAIEAFSSARSGVKGFGFRRASRASRIADAVRLEM